jgi:hypothetical protein
MNYLIKSCLNYFQISPLLLFSYYLPYFFVFWYLVMLFSLWHFNTFSLRRSCMRISFCISLLNDRLSFSRINIFFEGIHALGIWRTFLRILHTISSTSSKLQSVSFQFIPVSISHNQFGHIIRFLLWMISM